MFKIFISIAFFCCAFSSWTMKEEDFLRKIVSTSNLKNEFRVNLFYQPSQWDGASEFYAHAVDGEKVTVLDVNSELIHEFENAHYAVEIHPITGGWRVFFIMMVNSLTRKVLYRDFRENNSLTAVRHQ